MRKDIKDVDLSTIEATAKFAKIASMNAEPFTGGVCCARVYVTFSGKLNKSSKAAKTLEACGFKMTPRPYYSGVHIYVGYDNATGSTYGRALSIAKTFEQAGIGAYADADED